MPLYGFYIEKDIPDAPGRKNQYYIQKDTLGAALERAQNIYDFERMCHSTVTTFSNIHVWRVGSGRTDFTDLPVADPGMIAIGGAYNGPKQVVTLELGTEVGYGGYKDYRLAMGDDQVVGQYLTGGMEDLLATALDTYMPVITQLCTRQGKLFTSATWVSKVDYRQLSKSWYNRSI